MGGVGFHIISAASAALLALTGPKQPLQDLSPAKSGYAIQLPGSDWSLVLSLPGFHVQAEQQRPNGSGSMMQAENEETGIVISVFLEREKRPRSNTGCRDT